jgi:hypothetical protein
MDFWEALLVSLGGNVALLGGLWFLLRAFSQHALAKDLERFRAELSASAAAELERLKAELQRGAIEHQVRFSKHHEIRAEVIAAIYARLNDAHERSHWFAISATEDNYRAAENAAVEFYKYFNRHKLYLPAALGDKLEQFVREMRRQVGELEAYALHVNEHAPPNVLREKWDKWIESTRFFDREVPAARSALEVEMRAILDPGAPPPEQR